MKRWLFAIGSAVLAAAAACSSFSGDTPTVVEPPPVPDAAPDETDEIDAGEPDAATPACDIEKDFAPARIYLHDDGEQFDAVTLGDYTYFVTLNNVDGGPQFRMVTTVAYGDGGHSALQNVHLPAEQGIDKSSPKSPSFSADGKTLYYLSRGGSPNSGIDQLYRATRTSASLLTFDGPKVNQLALISSTFTGKSLWFSRHSTGANIDRVYRVDPASDNTQVDGGIDRPDINDVVKNTSHFVAAEDEKRVYFASDRDGLGVRGRLDVWVAIRDDATGLYKDAAPVPNLSTDRDEYPTWVSRNGCQILITRYGTDGKRDVYYSEKPN